MEKEVLENHQLYLERKKLYLSFGCDVDKERKFIFDAARPISGSILEVGTGKGHFTLTLANSGFRVTSIDISESEQRFARLNIKYFGLEDLVDFRVSNAEKLDFKDKSFNAVFSINTFHHLNEPFKVINEMIRVLTPKGKLIIADFTKEGLCLMDKIHKSEGNAHQVSPVTLADLEVYLLEKEFVTHRTRSILQDVLCASMGSF